MLALTPPRRRAAQRDLGRVTLLAALALAGCGGGAEAVAPTTPPSRGGGELARPAAPTTSTEAPPPAVAAAPPATTPPPEEPIPEQLGTPASSRAAAPAWWLDRDEPSYAPSPPNAMGLFEAAAAPGGGDDPAALACAFNIGHFREDTFFTRSQAAADMVIHARFGKKEPRPVFVTFNGWDRNAAVFVLPLARLQPGDALSLRIDDANVFSPDTLDHVQSVFQGSYPLKLRGRLTQGECRAVGRAAIEATAKGAKALLDREIEAFSRGKLYLSSPSMVHSSEGVRSAARSLAGLVGWDDPRLTVRLERIEAITAAQTAALGREVEAVLQGLAPGPTRLADGMVEVAPEPLQCGDDAVRKYRRFARSADDTKAFREASCAVVLGVTNRTRLPLELDRLRGAIGPAEDLMLVSPQGGRYDVELAAEVTPQGLRAFPRDGQKKVAPGRTLRVLALLLDTSDAGPPSPPLLLRALHDHSSSAGDASTPTRFAGAVELRGTAFACDADAKARYEARRNAWVRSLTGGVCVLDAEVKNVGITPLVIYSSGISLGPIHGLALTTAKKNSLQLGTLEVGGKAPPSRVEVAPGASVTALFMGERADLPRATPTLTELTLRAAFSSTLGFGRVD